LRTVRWILPHWVVQGRAQKESCAGLFQPSARL